MRVILTLLLHVMLTPGQVVACTDKRLLLRLAAVKILAAPNRTDTSVRRWPTPGADFKTMDDISR